jgi:hypothetical protein
MVSSRYFRARTRARRGPGAERFARIPHSVLHSEAVTSLPHAAFRILVILAAGYRGNNNGALALTEYYARRYGFKGRDTLYRSLRELETRGLIVCTRRGIKAKKVFSLYALGWEDIDNRDGQVLDTPEQRDCARWLNWTGPSKRRQRRKTEIHTDDRESSVPMAGSEHALCVPMTATSNAVSVPMTGNTLRLSPGRASERMRDADASVVGDLQSKLRKLLAELPELGDSDIARMLSTDIQTVRAARTCAPHGDAESAMDGSGKS